MESRWRLDGRMHDGQHLQDGKKDNRKPSQFIITGLFVWIQSVHFVVQFKPNGVIHFSYFLWSPCNNQNMEHHIIFKMITDTFLSITFIREAIKLKFCYFLSFSVVTLQQPKHSWSIISFSWWYNSRLKYNTYIIISGQFRPHPPNPLPRMVSDLSWIYSHFISYVYVHCTYIDTISSCIM